MFNSVSASILRPAGNEIIVEGIMGASGLGSLLVKEGFLTEQDRVTITKTCGQGSWAFAKTILAIGLLDEDELAAFFAERTKYIVASRDFLDHLDQGAIQSIDKRMISKLEILPMKRDADKITVAVLDPLDRSTLKQLEFFTGLIVEPVIAPMSQLYEGLVRLDPDFSPRDTSLSQFLQNHVGAAWVKQRIINGDDVMDTGATPAPSNFEFREDDVEELDDDDSGIEAVDDEFDDVAQDASDDFDDGMEDGDGVTLDAEDDPFAGTKSTEENGSLEASDDNSDDLFAEGATAGGDELEAGDELASDADEATSSGSDDDFFPAETTEEAESAADLLAEADDEFGDAPLDAGDLTESLAPAKKSVSGAKAADAGPPVVDEDDAIFDALEDDSPSLGTAPEGDSSSDEETGLDASLDDLTETAADDFGASDDLGATDEFNAGDEISVGEDLSASDFGSEGETLGEDFSADDFAAEADDFGADEKPEAAKAPAPQNSRQAASSKSAFDAEEETAINLRPSPRPSNDDDDIALHPPKDLPDADERDPGLTATALLNEALLRLSLCFDKESVDALLNETLPRMSAAGCLIRTDGPVRSWAQGKEGPSKLPKGALENLTTKSKEGKWQKISLSRPQSWTTKDLSLSAYRTGNWIWAHDSGEENEIFIETVESFVNQLQGK